MRRLARMGASPNETKPRTCKPIVRLAAMGSVALALGCAGPGLPPAGPAPGFVDVGYGTARGEDVTGSLSSITEEKVNGSAALTLPELLRGRVAGLRVVETAAGVSYRLRGVNSLYGDQAPLFVVNGVPVSAEDVDRAMSGVVMADVRQVDVLKDVASTSIFGSRGAGGVIIITTRR